MAIALLLQADIAASQPASADTAPLAAAWRQAEVNRAAGKLLEADRLLQYAAGIARSDSEVAGTALRRAAVLAESGQTVAAREQLAQAMALDSLTPDERPRLAETLAAIEARAGNYAAAEAAFDDAAAGFAGRDNMAGATRSAANALRARLDAGEIAGLEARLLDLDRMAATLPVSDANARLWLAVGELHLRAVTDFRSPPALLATAQQNFQRALDNADDDATRAFALGFMGGLYERAGRWAEADRLTNQALFRAQAANATDQVYRWEWQLARIQRAQGELPAAAASMDRALASLGGIRGDLLQSARTAFGRVIEPAYLDYADVNLQRAALMTADSPEQQRALRQVRDQLESLKLAEVEDYFEDRCIAADSTPPGEAFDIPGAAVVYPILLADRLEVLVETAGILRRFAVPVSRGEVTAATRLLRVGLEQPRAGRLYLEPAQALHGWLLQDAEPWLQAQGVDTLVFVPGGALRTVPLGALHNGESFVIERFAVATTPAISLVTELKADRLNNLFVAGLSDSVQGFAGLPSVAEEIRTLSTLFPATALQNEAFQLAAVENGLASPVYSVAHLATHGEFSSDHRQSFILTFDDRLTMDRLKSVLSERRATPLDMLVLSACRTAAGDDRAALGLAGVALQAGARSAVASLWYISDAATTTLMSAFYENLKTGSGSTAGSLRSAQLQLLNTPEYGHPSFWAPYLLIGNWL